MKFTTLFAVCSIAFGTILISSAETRADYLNCRKTYSGGEVCSGTVNGQSYYGTKRRTYSGGYTESGSSGGNSFYRNCRTTYSGGKTCS